MSSILSNLLRQKKTLGGLQALASPQRSSGAGGCNVQFIEAYHEIRREGIIEKFKKFFTRQKGIMNTHLVTWKFQVSSGTGGVHTVIARGTYDPSGTLGASNEFQIFCDCKDFIYRSAYTLNQCGSKSRSKDSIRILGPK